MTFQIYNPLLIADWDDYLYRNDQSGFFHTSAWAEVLTSAYRYRPVYFTEIEEKRIAALLPVMEIDSFLTGRRGVSLPFSDSCAPLAQSEEQLQALIGAALEYACNHNWRWIEFRADDRLPLQAEPTRVFKQHTLALEDSRNDLEKKIRKSTLRHARSADREGIRIARLRSLTAMRDFYRLMCLTRKRHGLPPQPWYFFEALLEKLVQRRNGDVFLALYGNTVVAGAVFLHYRNKALYKFGASDERFHPLRANNLIMWTAIQYYLQSGYQTIEFGRTDAGHSGLLQYKRGWGAKETTLYYYRYDTKRQAFIKNAKTSPPGNDLFRRLPIPILRLIGQLLYPHVG